MKAKRLRIGALGTGFLCLLMLVSAQAQAVTMPWNTFMGSTVYDVTQGIAVDGSGNVYVTGASAANWGSPVNPYADNTGFDSFVAKFDSIGTLLWHTFLGGTYDDVTQGIAVDGFGNVYVTGYSLGTWGSDPKNPYAGSQDAFVAKLDSSGHLVWNTFMGSASGADDGKDIAVDGSGNVYVTGDSLANWGSPKIAHAGGVFNDAFVAKIADNGTLVWNTFMGAAGSSDYGNGIALDGSGNLYVAGRSLAGWGPSPVNAYAGSDDVFVAKLDSSGTRLWNTFMGSAGSADDGKDIAVDGSGSVYVTGYSAAAWGSPIHAYAGDYDCFVAKLDSSGIRQWHTFMGSTASDSGQGIAVDGAGNPYVTGQSNAAWGSPINPYAGGGAEDGFVAKLDSSGALLWNTFMGSTSGDCGSGIAVDRSDNFGNLYVTGYSLATWGSPIHAYAGDYDGFVAKINDCVDADGDGYGAGAGCLAVDCNDADNTTYPGAVETCNGRDDDCDGETDEGLTISYYYRDADNDTYGDADNATQACGAPTGFVPDNSDCDDTDGFLYDICPECTVKVIPKALGWFLGEKEKNRTLIVIGKRGTVYDENTAVRWETDAIEVVKKNVFFKRFMLLKVSIDGAALDKGEYRGLIGECTGTLKLVK